MLGIGNPQVSNRFPVLKELVILWERQIAHTTICNPERSMKCKGQWEQLALVGPGEVGVREEAFGCALKDAV